MFKKRLSTGGENDIKLSKKCKRIIWKWKTSLLFMIGHFERQTNRKWRIEVRPAVSDQGQWKTLGTVPVEGPSVWLQASHSASWSLPPYSFNYRASASSTQERRLGELLFWEAWCCCKKVLQLLIHSLHHRHDYCSTMILGWVIIRAVYNAPHPAVCIGGGPEQRPEADGNLLVIHCQWWTMPCNYVCGMVHYCVHIL